MIIILTEDLALSSGLDCSGVRLVNTAFELLPGVDQGHITTPLFPARMAAGYFGFEVRRELGVTIAPLRASGVAQVFLDGRWQDTAAPLFYTGAQLRQVLPLWAGPIQFLLRLDRFEDGRSPQIRQVVAGYEVGREFLDYLMEFALRQFLTVPVTLTRAAMPNPEGNALPLPKDLKQDRISDIRVLVPELKMVSGTLGSDRILLSELVPGDRAVEMHLSYKPKVDHEVGVYQVEEIPCVLLRLLEGENYRKPIAQDFVRIAGDQARLLELTQVYDQPVEVEIIGATLGDVKAIHKALVNQIGKGKMDAPAYGLSVFLVGRSGLQIGDQLQKTGTLFSVRFRLTIKDLWDGEQVEDVAVVKTIAVGLPSIGIPQ
jgi:hypothetical protein